MTDYYASQSGAGAADGSSVADPWPVASIVWTTVAQNTLYLLDAITSNVDIAANGDGTATNRTVVRGDYPGKACTITTTSTHGITNQGAEYVDIRDITFEGDTGTYGGINVSFNNNYNRVYNNTFNKARGVILNGADDCEIYDNTVTMTDGFSGIGVRLFNGAKRNIIQGNTISSEDRDSANFQTGIIVEGSTSDNNTVRRNGVNDIAGDGIVLRDDTNNNEVESNIVGPYVYQSCGLESSHYNRVHHNYFGNLSHEGNEEQPCLKLGNWFDAGDPSDYNIIYNNILYADGIIKRILQAGGGGSGVTNSMGDNNVFVKNIVFHENPPDAFGIVYCHDSSRNSYYTFDNWLTLGYDSESISEDPDLDAEQKPQENSPALGFGRPVDARDYLGRCFGDPPNCGPWSQSSI